MFAQLKNYRQSPRKVRLVADLIRGKTVGRAYVLLRHTPKRATAQIKKLLDSAIANASQKDDVLKEDLVVKNIRVDEGRTLKRFRPVSRGRAQSVKKRTSHISIELETQSLGKNAKGKMHNEAEISTKK